MVSLPLHGRAEKGAQDSTRFISIGIDEHDLKAVCSPFKGRK